MSSAPSLLEVRDICKSFPGVRTLDRVNLRLARGEGLAVVGENGAGKSTLMKILAGVYRPDSGTIVLEGRVTRIDTTSDAQRLGISLIHQELNLAENLSVAANVFLGRERCWGGPLYLMDQAAMNRGAVKLLERVGLYCPPQTIVGTLAPGQRQLVEIARSLSLDARILIMDEPTSSLTQAETDRLYQVVDDLKAAGVAVVYISHRLAEVERIADRVMVLRDGRNAGELWARKHLTMPGSTGIQERDRRTPIAPVEPATGIVAAEAEGGPRPASAAAVDQAVISHDNMVRLMVGRDLKQFFHRQHQPQRGGVPRLEVRRLLYANGPRTPVSFQIFPGEVVGMAGLVGAGRTELSEALFGLRRLIAGEVLVDGRPVRIRRPSDAIAAGMALVPEDRRHHGLILEDTVEHNVGLPNLPILSWLGLVNRPREARLAEETRDRLHVRTPTIRQVIGVLSGGNQQKVVLGKWLARKPRVLLFDEPTRGIDVGAKSEIYALMDHLTGEGVSILMISSDMEEVLGVSDRVLVMHEGRLAGSLERDELSEEAIMHLATGRTTQESRR